MNPPEDPGLVAWLLDHAWTAVIALVAVVWKQNESAVKAANKESAAALQAHKEEDQRAFKAVHEEQATQRGHIGKLFDQMRDESQRSEVRHRELMERVHDSHRELLMALNSKADK